MVQEAGGCGIRNSRGNSQETNVKQGACQGHIASSTGDASFCSKTIPGYTHCHSYTAVEMGRWRMFLLTASSYTETPAQTWLPAGTCNCTLSRPEHASSLGRETGARSDMSSSLIMKKCEPLLNKQCFKC